MGSACKAFLAPNQDELCSPVRVIFNLIVPKPNDHPTLAFKERGPAGVIYSSKLMSVPTVAVIKANRSFPLKCQKGERHLFR